MSQITLIKNDPLAENTDFTEMVGRVKKRYRQMAEYLGVVCRVDLQIPVNQSGLLKMEKLIESLLRDLMANDALVAMSIVSYSDDGNYVITISGHFQKKPWYKPEEIPVELVQKAKKIGVTIKTTCQTGIKLSYDLYLDPKLSFQN